MSRRDDGGSHSESLPRRSLTTRRRRVAAPGDGARNLHFLLFSRSVSRALRGARMYDCEFLPFP